jgi:hypothetical protein
MICPLTIRDQAEQYLAPRQFSTSQAIPGTFLYFKKGLIQYIDFCSKALKGTKLDK